MAAIELLAAVVGACVTIVWYGRSRDVSASVPRELRRAQLAYSEKAFSGSAPIGLVARPDRVYRVSDGRLLLVEFKTSHRGRAMDQRDMIQLSAQRVAVEMQTGKRVLPYAYVALVAPPSEGRTSWHRVTMLPTSQVVALSHRREAILAGKLEAARAQNSCLCRSCPYSRECAALPRSLPMCP
jgi:hypothetical protein